MESHAQAVEDYLIDGLSFKLAPGASYVTNRRSVGFFPTRWKCIFTKRG
jgi:hypothetical protein